MAATNNVENTVSVHDQKADPEKTPASDSGLGVVGRPGSSRWPSRCLVGRLGGWCCSFSSPGWINSVDGFQQYYEVGLLKDYASTEIAWIPSLQLFFLFALACPISCVSTWFSEKYGIAMGIMVTGSSLGGVVFPIIISRLIQSTGCPWAIRSTGFLILGLQIIAALTVCLRTEPVPKKMSAGCFAAPFKKISFVILLLGIFIQTNGIFILIVYLAMQAAGYSADLIEIWNIFIIACTLCGISEFAPWIPAKQPCIAIGFAITPGFVPGAFIGLIGALLILVSPLPETGYRLGVVFLDVKIFSGVLCLAGSAIILVSRLLYTEKEFFKKF
ncbi:major facilitator superfamily domain-containing protein [Ustulina deusta]|nr:major facilitator superfamily domain-containing protein [Ustulina deusta]